MPGAPGHSRKWVYVFRRHPGRRDAANELAEWTANATGVTWARMVATSEGKVPRQPNRPRVRIERAMHSGHCHQDDIAGVPVVKWCGVTEPRWTLPAVTTRSIELQTMPTRSGRVFPMAWRRSGIELADYDIMRSMVRLRQSLSMCEPIALPAYRPGIVIFRPTVGADPVRPHNPSEPVDFLFNGSVRGKSLIVCRFRRDHLSIALTSIQRVGQPGTLCCARLSCLRAENV